MWYYYLIGAVLFLLMLVLLVSYICYRKVFYSKPRVPLPEGEYGLPRAPEYRLHYDELRGWIDLYRTLPSEELEITSFDGLKLRGRYFEREKGAVTELLFHGYRGSGERNMSAGIERCFALGRNALIVDERASGRSEGHVITFGINEYRDCLSWIDFAVKKFGEEVKLIISGVSMGAATVMIAAGEKLPKNVVCALADCGYSTARDIIKKVIREMRLPADLMFPFVKLGGLLFGRFNIDATSPKEALAHASIPVIFIHGDIDGFVPCDMSRELYEICTSKKKLTVIEGAEHALAYPTNKEKYLCALSDFKTECGF